MKISWRKSALSWTWVSLLVIVFDQATKYLALHHLSYDKPVAILPFLNFALRFNMGAAFSFLGGASGWQIYLLSAIAFVASVVLLLWLRQLKRSDAIAAIPLCLILGGAIGNLVDRVRFGYVVDFIDFHIRTWHFATFNVADAAVSIGAALLILRLLYENFIGKP